MSKMILLGNTEGTTKATVLCPVCTRISREQLAKPAEDDPALTLAEPHTCPVCKSVYTACSAEWAANYLSSFERYLKNTESYNSAVKDSYAQKTAGIVSAESGPAKTVSGHAQSPETPAAQAVSPDDEKEAAVTAELDHKIEYWKRELLDTGRRNRMINYKDTRGATLKILEPEASELFAKLAAEKELKFQMPVSKESDLRTYSMIALMETLSYQMPVAIGDIKTDGTIMEREKTLKNLRSKAKLAQEEQGTNILYLSFGFIYWREQNRDSSPWMKSPLLMMPVSLGHKSLSAPFTLSKYDDEIEVNPTLDYLFNAEYGIDLPTFELKSKDSFDEYLAAVAELIDKRGWKLSREVSLGLLSYLKISMYHDLNNNRDLMLKNPVLRAMAGDRAALGPLPAEAKNYDFDAARPEDWHEVVNSDSSQEEAILLSKLGTSFVMQGPPGTGKSQTITNIIAEALADGKKVLFVSEKAAALQVVLKRLTDVGLADFCLSLHNYKANKKEIIDSIGANLSIEKEYIEGSALRELSDLLRCRSDLNLYADELHRVIEPLGESLYMVFGKLSKLEKAPVVTLSLDHPETITADGYAALVSAVSSMEKALHAMGGKLSENPWFRTRAVSAGQNYKTELLEKTEGLSRDLYELDSIAKELNETYHAGLDTTWNALAMGITELEKTAKLPQFTTAWLNKESRAVMKTQAGVEFAKQADYDVHRTELSKTCTDSILDAPVNAWDERLTEAEKLLTDAGFTAPETVSAVMAEPETMKEKAQEITSRLSALTLGYQSAGALFGIDGPDTKENLRTAGKTAGILAGCSSAMLPGWFERAAQVRAKNLAAEAEERALRMKETENRVLDAWDSAVMNLDLTALQNCFGRDDVAGGLDAATAEETIVKETEDTEKALAHLSTVSDAVYACEELFRLPKRDSGADVKMLSHLLEILIGTEHLSAAWFDPRKNEEIRTLCEEAAACAKTMLAKKAAVLADWEPAALDIDTDAILARFKTEYVGMLRKLKSGYKEDMKTLRLHAKAVGAALDEQKVIAFLQDAKEIKTRRAWFESHETALREAVGADYRGAETPWEKILTGLTAAARIKELFPYGMISGETMEAIAAVPYSMDYSGLARRAADTLQPARIEEELAHAAVWCSDYTDNLSVSQKLCPMLSGHLEQLKARRESLDAFRASKKDGILRYQDINNLLSDLALIRMESSWFERNDTDNRTLLGPEYQGRESEWKKLHDGLFAAGELTALFDGTVPQALIAYACSENHAELPDAVLALDETAVRELSDEIAAFPGYPYEEEQSFSADLLPAFRTCLQAAETISDVLTLVRPYLAEAVEPGMIAGTIRTAAEVKAERDSITARAEQLTAMFGVRYNGTETDWQGLLEDLDVIDTFLDTEGSAVNEYFLHTLGTATSSMRAQLNEKLDRVKELLSGTNDRLAAFEAQFEGTDFRSQSIASAAARYDACLDGFDALNHWLDYMETRAECDKLGLSAFTAAVDEKDNTIADVTAAFERAFAAEWIEAVIENVPAVQKFRRRVHEDRIARFHTLDNSQFALSSKRIREKIIETFPDLETVEKSSSQLGILRHEMDKKRRYMPLRRLFASIPDLLLTLKPCLMMSPLSVAYFLEAGAYQFDMVIFDEASQIFPQDAIGAIFRGKQVIIAGDTKQLPPTSFFSSSTGNSDTDADENEDTFDEEVYDSILEETAGLLPNRTLLWHYRSRHEHLIAYSNHEIYKNELVTFPSCVERAPDVGVEFIYVEDGYYESNGRNCNLPEAKRIVELVKEHIDLHPDRSLGIIAFSEKQQNAINLEIQRFRERNPEYEAFFAEGKEDEFFVKNLENVQGDERDTIIFSVGYAKTKEQKAKDQPMSMRFGPLGIQGGERRLNVAITRAKINIKLVSSILPSDIDLTRTESEGIRMLRGYLEFAKNGEVSLGAQKKNVRRDEFAESVADFLREAGYHVKQYVGCSGYKIDIAVEDEESHRFIAGIECDGYSYTSARTARDRDRLRSSVLHSMGWNLYRMWSSEWYKNPELEGKKLITFIEKSKEANAEKEKAEAEERAASEKARQAAEEEKAQELARKKAAAEAAERKRIAEEARKEAERIAAKEAKRLAANEKRRAERAAKREAMKAAEPAAHEAEPMSAPEPEKSAPKKKTQKRTHTGNSFDWVVPGAHITHSAYGDGVIEEVHDAYLTASFSDGVKKFQNPGALESGFIKKAGENE